MSPDDSSPLPPRDGLGTGIEVLAIVLVACNVMFAVWLWRSQNAQNGRLTRLEKRLDLMAADPAADVPGHAALGAHPRRAGVDERVALLLSLAGDPEHSRRMLEAVSPEETAAIATALLARPPANDRNAALLAVIAAIARTDSLRAIGLLNGVQEPVLRARLASDIADTWAGSHPDDAVRWLVNEGARYLDPASAAAPLLRALSQWAAFDPESATKFAADQPSDRGPITRALGLASLAWGHKDPAAALTWVQTLPVADQRRELITQKIWQGWSEQDPAGAANALGQQLYNGGRIYTDLAGTVARAWAGVDAGASAQWAMTLPTGAARRNALYQVAVTWTQSDPAGASRWAANLPASAVRAEIWREIVGTWAETDLDNAGSWLGMLPLGRDHDAAVAAYLPKLEGTEPEKALSWAGTIAEGEVRADQVQGILGRWAQRDSAAARNWAAASGVSVPAARSAP